MYSNKTNNSNNSNNAKTTMKLIFALCILFQCFNAGTAANAPTNTYDDNGLLIKTPCPKWSTKMNCTCSTPCLEHQNNTLFCVAKKCTGYNEALKHCVWKSKDKTTALVLQAIPVTATLGVSWGVIGRWDWLAVIWAPVGGICIISAFLTCLCSKSEDSGEACVVGSSSCLAVIYGLAMCVVWIYGIVAIANSDMTDGNGCHIKYKNTLYNPTDRTMMEMVINNATAFRANGIVFRKE